MLAAIFQMTYVGAPMIYYGDEVGMWGADDPCLPQAHGVGGAPRTAPRPYCPDQKPRPHADPVTVDRALLEHYRTCIGIRNRHVALRNGNFKTLLTDDGRGIYAFSRTAGQETVVVVLTTTVTGPSSTRLQVGPGTWKDELAGGKACVADAQGLHHREARRALGRCPGPRRDGPVAPAGHAGLVGRAGPIANKHGPASSLTRNPVGGGTPRDDDFGRVPGSP